MVKCRIQHFAEITAVETWCNIRATPRLIGMAIMSSHSQAESSFSLADDVRCGNIGSRDIDVWEGCIVLRKVTGMGNDAYFDSVHLLF